MAESKLLSSNCVDLFYEMNFEILKICVCRYIDVYIDSVFEVNFKGNLNVFARNINTESHVSINTS